MEVRNKEPNSAMKYTIMENNPNISPTKNSTINKYPLDKDLSIVFNIGPSFLNLLTVNHELNRSFNYLYDYSDENISLVEQNSIVNVLNLPLLHNSNIFKSFFSLENENNSILSVNVFKDKCVCDRCRAKSLSCSDGNSESSSFYREILKLLCSNICNNWDKEWIDILIKQLKMFFDCFKNIVLVFERLILVAKEIQNSKHFRVSKILEKTRKSSSLFPGTGKEKLDVIDNISIASFETERDMEEYSRLEERFNKDNRLEESFEGNLSEIKRTKHKTNRAKVDNYENNIDSAVDETVAQSLSETTSSAEQRAADKCPVPQVCNQDEEDDDIIFICESFPKTLTVTSTDISTHQIYNKSTKSKDPKISIGCIPRKAIESNNTLVSKSSMNKNYNNYIMKEHSIIQPKICSRKSSEPFSRNVLRIDKKYIKIQHPMFQHRNSDRKSIESGKQPVSMNSALHVYKKREDPLIQEKICSRKSSESSRELFSINGLQVYNKYKECERPMVQLKNFSWKSIERSMNSNLQVQDEHKISEDQLIQTTLCPRKLTESCKQAFSLQTLQVDNKYNKFIKIDHPVIQSRSFPSKSTESFKQPGSINSIPQIYDNHKKCEDLLIQATICPTKLTESCKQSFSMNALQVGNKCRKNEHSTIQPRNFPSKAIECNSPSTSSVNNYCNKYKKNDNQMIQGRIFPRKLTELSKDLKQSCSTSSIKICSKYEDGEDPMIQAIIFPSESTESSKAATEQATSNQNSVPLHNVNTQNQMIKGGKELKLLSCSKDISPRNDLIQNLLINNDELQIWKVVNTKSGNALGTAVRNGNNEQEKPVKRKSCYEQIEKKSSLNESERFRSSLEKKNVNIISNEISNKQLHKRGMQTSSQNINKIQFEGLKLISNVSCPTKIEGIKNKHSKSKENEGNIPTSSNRVENRREIGLGGTGIEKDSADKHLRVRAIKDLGTIPLLHRCSEVGLTCSCKTFSLAMVLNLGYCRPLDEYAIKNLEALRLNEEDEDASDDESDNEKSRRRKLLANNKISLRMAEVAASAVYTRIPKITRIAVPVVSKFILNAVSYWNLKLESDKLAAMARRNDVIISEEIKSSDVIVNEEVKSNDAIVSEEIKSNKEVKSNDVIVSKKVKSNGEIVSEEVKSNGDIVSKKVKSNGDIVSEEIKSNDFIVNKKVKSNDVIVSKKIRSNGDIVSEEVKSNDVIVSKTIRSNGDIVSEEVKSNDVIVSKKVKSNGDIVSEEVKSNDVIVSKKVKSNDAIVSEEIKSNKEVKSNDVIVSKKVKSNGEIVSEEVKSNGDIVSKKVKSNGDIVSEEVKSNDVIVSKKIKRNDVIVSNKVKSNGDIVSKKVKSNGDIVSEEVKSNDVIVSKKVKSNDVIVSNKVKSNGDIVSEEVMSTINNLLDIVEINVPYYSDDGSEPDELSQLLRFRRKLILLPPPPGQTTTLQKLNKVDNVNIKLKLDTPTKPISQNENCKTFNKDLDLRRLRRELNKRAHAKKTKTSKKLLNVPGKFVNNNCQTGIRNSNVHRDKNNKILADRKDVGKRKPDPITCIDLENSDDEIEITSVQRQHNSQIKNREFRKINQNIQSFKSTEVACIDLESVDEPEEVRLTSVEYKLPVNINKAKQKGKSDINSRESGEIVCIDLETAAEEDDEVQLTFVQIQNPHIKKHIKRPRFSYFQKVKGDVGIKKTICIDLENSPGLDDEVEVTSVELQEISAISKSNRRNNDEKVSDTDKSSGSMSDVIHDSSVSSDSASTDLQHNLENKNCLVDKDNSIKNQDKVEPSVVSRNDDHPSVLSQVEGQPTVVSRNDDHPSVVSQVEGQPTVVSRNNDLQHNLENKNGPVDKDNSIKNQDKDETSVVSRNDDHPSVLSQVEGQPSFASQDNVDQHHSSVVSQDEDHPTVVSQNDDHPSVVSQVEGQPSFASQDEGHPSVRTVDQYHSSVVRQDEDHLLVVSRGENQPSVTIENLSSITEQIEDQSSIMKVDEDCPSVMSQNEDHPSIENEDGDHPSAADHTDPTSTDDEHGVLRNKIVALQQSYTKNEASSECGKTDSLGSVRHSVRLQKKFYPKVHADSHRVERVALKALNALVNYSTSNKDEQLLNHRLFFPLTGKQVPVLKQKTLWDMLIWCDVHFKYNCDCSLTIYYLKPNTLLWMPLKNYKKTPQSVMTKIKLENLCTKNEVAFYDSDRYCARTFGSVINYRFRNKSVVFKKKRLFEVSWNILTSTNCYVKMDTHYSFRLTDAKLVMLTDDIVKSDGNYTFLKNDVCDLDVMVADELKGVEINKTSPQLKKSEGSCDRKIDVDAEIVPKIEEVQTKSKIVKRKLSDDAENLDFHHNSTSVNPAKKKKSSEQSKHDTHLTQQLQKNELFAEKVLKTNAENINIFSNMNSDKMPIDTKTTVQIGARGRRLSQQEGPAATLIPKKPTTMLALNPSQIVNETREQIDKSSPNTKPEKRVPLVITTDNYKLSLQKKIVAIFHDPEKKHGIIPLREHPLKDSIYDEDNVPKLSLICSDIPELGYITVVELKPPAMTVQDPEVPQFLHTFSSIEVACKWINKFLKTCISFDTHNGVYSWIIVKPGILKLKQIKPFSVEMLRYGNAFINKDKKLILNIKENQTVLPSAGLNMNTSKRKRITEDSSQIEEEEETDISSQPKKPSLSCSLQDETTSPLSSKCFQFQNIQTNPTMARMKLMNPDNSLQVDRGKISLKINEMSSLKVNTPSLMKPNKRFPLEMTSKFVKIDENDCAFNLFSC